jgi:hypothetical protein
VSNSKALEAAYKQIEDETSWLEATIRAWKKRYNMLSVISRLLPEILSTVFKFLVASFKSAGGSSRIRWTTISHVCTHWRQVALECRLVDHYLLFAFQLGRGNVEAISRDAFGSIDLFIEVRFATATVDPEYFDEHVSDSEALFS